MSRPSRLSGRCGWGVALLLTVCGLLLSLPPCFGRSRSGRGASQREEAKRQSALKALQSGRAELLAKRYAKAYRQLALAYRSAPSPETLQLLGQLALAEGRSTEAQDLLRRYLADPTVDANAEQNAAAKAVAERPRGRSGELNVVGDQGSILLLDGRVVGALPLTQPLLLSPGRHRVSLESDGRTLQGEVTLPGGRGAEMRFSEESRAVLLTLPPALLVMVDWASGPPSLRPPLEQAIERLARGLGLMIYSSDSALAEAGLPASQDLGACWELDSCRAQLLAGQAVEHALRLQLKSAVAGKPGSGVTLSLFETAVGEDAARQTVSCESCGTEQLLAKLLPELDKVLRQGVGRPRGELEIKSEPSGAEVVVGGRRLGTTPLLRPMFIGVYDPELSLPGYQRQSLRVVVSEGKAARYLLSLESEPEPEPEPLLDGGKLRRERRPTWRLQAGGSLLGIGVGLLGLSAWPLALDGTCQRPPAVATDPCVNLYETRAPGLALSIAGGALMITGGILLLIPGRRIRSARLIPPSE